MRSEADAVGGWLLAPDSFKGTFSAREVAAAIGAGVREAGGTVDACPVADGGEGTLDVLVEALGGTRIRQTAHDPLGRQVEAQFAVLAGGVTAIVETATASGLPRVAVDERNAEAATSAGTGELIAAAAALGVRRILVGVGGSACTDGGAGAVEAIRVAGGLRGAAVEVLCDSTTPFEDAARVFGPQKGADPDAVGRLTERLERYAAGLPHDPRGVPRSGCAGGLSGALWACFDATLSSGADAVLDAVAFDARAATAGHVVTGEGCLDRQSVDGKLVSVVARRARAVGATPCAVVGRSRLTDREVHALGLAAVYEATSLGDLRDTGRRLGCGSVDSTSFAVQSCAQ